MGRNKCRIKGSQVADTLKQRGTNPHRIHADSGVSYHVILRHLGNDNERVFMDVIPAFLEGMGYTPDQWPNVRFGDLLQFWRDGVEIPFTE